MGWLRMAWKNPMRPRTDNGVTQCFGSGVVKIYTLRDSARPGYQPIPELVRPERYSLRYEERSLGIRRLYEARQNQVQIERVIRVPRCGRITNQDAAVTEDGNAYKIYTVQAVEDVYPPCLDLALSRIEQEVRL